MTDSIAKLWGLGAFKYYISRLLVYFFVERSPLCPFFFSAGGVNAWAGVLPPTALPNWNACGEGSYYLYHSWWGRSQKFSRIKYQTWNIQQKYYNWTKNWICPKFVWCKSVADMKFEIWKYSNNEIFTKTSHRHICTGCEAL